MGSKLFYLVFFIIIPFWFWGQKEVDSLSQKDYMELFADLNKSKTLDGKVEYAEYILNKAKKENNRELIIAGYHTMVILYEDENVLRYADSIIALTKENSDAMYPAEAFRMKGVYYHNKKDYNKALDNYIIVSEYAKKHKDDKLLYKSKHSIAIIKRLIGKPEESLELFKENLAFAERNINVVDSINYLISLASVANLYNDIKNGDSASHYNRIGLNKAIEFGSKEHIKHFSLNQGLSHYYQGKYIESIDSITKHVTYFEEKPNPSTLSLSYFFCGKSYEKINDQTNAIKYFKKVDTIFRDNSYIFPSTKESYLKLIEYYKNKKDLKNQLHYLNQLLKVDSILNSQYNYANKIIYEKYEMPNLENEKERIREELLTKELNLKYSTIIFLGFSVIFIILIYYQIRLKRKYKRRFKEILQGTKKSTHKKKSNQKREINLPKEVIEDILKKLENFECKNQFIDTNITQTSLAIKLNTNSSYLSKIVNHYKNKSFSNYINSLRIEYFIEKVKNDDKIRKFTIKAIAEEVGFNNAESFSTAFYKLKGIKPSYFLREFENSIKNGRDL